MVKAIPPTLGNTLRNGRREAMLPGPEVADDHTSRAGSQIVDRRGALTGSRVQSDLMALIDERLRCGMA